MAKAGRVAAELINKEAGGILGGRKIEVLIEDSESSATAGVAAARKLLDIDKVSILAGVWNSSVAMACCRRSNIDHLCRLNFDQGLEPALISAGCG
jgi:ABC-type branched-subunit amino acid transport system substrate-binding protein